MTTPHHPRLWGDANARDAEPGETRRGKVHGRERGMPRTNVRVLPSPGVREIGGLQFPMDNGTLITP